MPRGLYGHSHLDPQVSHPPQGYGRQPQTSKSGYPLPRAPRSPKRNSPEAPASPVSPPEGAHLDPGIWGVPSAFCTTAFDIGKFTLDAASIATQQRSGSSATGTTTWSATDRSGTDRSGSSANGKSDDSDPPLPTAQVGERYRDAAPATLMLRNLPNRAKKDRIEEHMHSLGFHDFELHLPIDSRTGVNKGYAFIRLSDEATALRFIASVEQTQLPGGNSTSTKQLTAFFAANQGAPLALRPSRDRQ